VFAVLLIARVVAVAIFMISYGGLSEEGGVKCEPDSVHPETHP
jgi:hypothetical protein